MKSPVIVTNDRADFVVFKTFQKVFIDYPADIIKNLFREFRIVIEQITKVIKADDADGVFQNAVMAENDKFRAGMQVFSGPRDYREVGVLDAGPDIAVKRFPVGNESFLVQRFRLGGGMIPRPAGEFHPPHDNRGEIITAVLKSLNIGDHPRKFGFGIVMLPGEQFSFFLADYKFKQYRPRRRFFFQNRYQIGEIRFARLVS